MNVACKDRSRSPSSSTVPNPLLLHFWQTAVQYSGSVNLLQHKYSTVQYILHECGSYSCHTTTVFYREIPTEGECRAVQTRINENKLKVFVPGRASTAFHQATARGRTSYVVISSPISVYP